MFTVPLCIGDQLYSCLNYADPNQECNANLLTILSQAQTPITVMEALVFLCLGLPLSCLSYELRGYSQLSWRRHVHQWLKGDPCIASCRSNLAVLPRVSVGRWAGATSMSEPC